MSIVMSPRFRFIGLFGFVVIIGVLFFLSFRTPRIAQEQVSGTVSLIVDFSDPPAGGVREWKDVPYMMGQTAFSILKDATASVGLALYSSEASSTGVFIRQIGDKKNGDGGKYWQYWVNGKYAMVAADQKLLAPADIILWKFTSDVPTNY